MAFNRWSPLLIIIVIIFTSVPAAWAIQELGTLETTLTLEMVDGVTVPYQSGRPLPDFEPQDREVLDLGGAWKKERFQLSHMLSFKKRDAENLLHLETEADGRHLADYDDSGWEEHTLPGVESEMPGDQTAPPEGFHGGVWYRKTVQVTEKMESNINRLIFLGSNYITDIWINGQWAGVHEGGYTPFALDISELLIYGGENTIALRIDKPFPGFRQDMVPSWPLMDWWSYAGVIHDIYVESAPPVSIVRANTIPTSYNGNFEIQVVLENTLPDAADAVVELQIFKADFDAPGYLTDPSAKSIIGDQACFEGAGTKAVTVGSDDAAVLVFPIRIISPMRWTLKEPNLYVLKTTLSVKGEIIDVHHTQFGIRTVERDQGKLLINGRVAFLPGVARHEEWPDTGRTATWDRILEDLEVVQELNSLFLRSGHYPCHVYTYLLTDRMGIATMAELPVYWQMGWNWTYQAHRRVADQMFREMVFSNYNRPSIILWGTNNEPFFPFFTKLTQYNQRIADDYIANYPDGRLLSQSLAAGASWEMVATSQVPIDVAGWTLYYGVFYGDDPYTETLQFLADHKLAYPDYPVVGTEYGYWSGSSGDEEPKQLQVFEDTWTAFADGASLNTEGNVNPDGQLSAVSWWCIFNWFTKNGLPDFVAPYLQSMGLIHMDRQTWKPAADALALAYEPYFDFGGLGPEPDDYIGEEDCPEPPADDDDDSADDDDNDSGGGSDDDDDDGGCCG